MGCQQVSAMLMPVLLKQCAVRHAERAASAGSGLAARAGGIQAERAHERPGHHPERAQELQRRPDEPQQALRAWGARLKRRPPDSAGAAGTAAADTGSAAGAPRAGPSADRV